MVGVVPRVVGVVPRVGRVVPRVVGVVPRLVRVVPRVVRVVPRGDVGAQGARRTRAGQTLGYFRHPGYFY